MQIDHKNNRRFIFWMLVHLSFLVLLGGIINFRDQINILTLVSIPIYILVQIILYTMIITWKVRLNLRDFIAVAWITLIGLLSCLIFTIFFAGSIIASQLGASPFEGHPLLTFIVDSLFLFGPYLATGYFMYQTQVKNFRDYG